MGSLFHGGMQVFLEISNEAETKVGQKKWNRRRKLRMCHVQALNICGEVT